VPRVLAIINNPVSSYTPTRPRARAPPPYTAWRSTYSRGKRLCEWVYVSALRDSFSRR